MNEQQASILAGQWANLVRGAVDSKHDWHWPVLATIGRLASDSTPWPQVRTVVLRKADPAQRRLEVHSDSRAGKLADMLSSPAVMMHFYDQRSRTQLRIACNATIHQSNDVAQNAWQQLAPSSQTQYLEVNQQHFAVIHLNVFEIDWLWLAREGHQRLKFALQPDQTWSAQILKP